MNLDSFYNENKEKIFLRDEKLPLLDHSIIEDKLNTWYNYFEQIPEWVDKNYDKEAVEYANLYLRNIKYKASRIKNIKYVSVEQFKKELDDICDELFIFLKEKNITKIYICVHLKKSSFWAFLLIYDKFKENNISFEIIDLMEFTSSVKLDNNCVMIYPDDASYSGSQLFKIYRDIRQKLNKNGTKFTFIPLITRISAGFVEDMSYTNEIVFLNKTIRYNFLFDGLEDIKTDEFSNGHAFEVYIVNKLDEIKLTDPTESDRLFKFYSCMLDFIKKLNTCSRDLFVSVNLGFYFQHKMAVNISTGCNVLNNGPYYKSEFFNDGIVNLDEIEYLGSLINNCSRTTCLDNDTCPYSYYKKIEFLYNGEKIDLKNIKFDDIKIIRGGINPYIKFILY